MVKLAIIKTRSIVMPVRKAGIVYFVGSAAKLVTTTRTSALIAPMISLKTAPLKRIAVIVNGKRTAVITVIEIPAHAIRFFSSFFIQEKKRVSKFLFSIFRE